MINIKPQIFTLLKQIPDVKVSFFYPEDFKTLPCITYYEASNTEALRTDNIEQWSDIAIQIDIWSTTPEQNSALALQVDEKMSSIGFKRQFCGDLYNDGVHHKTMRYGGIVDVNTQLVYQD